MFFDSLGRILERAGEVLRTDVRAEIDDVFVGQQVDAIALIISEVGAAWTELFGALERVNGVLAETLARAGGAAVDGDGGDPLRRNAELLRALDARVASLHDAGDEAALRGLRRGLNEAAIIEQELLARARERSGMATTRRL